VLFVTVCCPIISCPPDINIVTCNQAIPAGANTLPDFVSLGGTYFNATAVSYSDATTMDVQVQQQGLILYQTLRVL
jgi:hypothetical protein